MLAWLGPLGDAVGSAHTGLVHLGEMAFPAFDVLAGTVVVVVLDRLRGGHRHPMVLAAGGVVLACLADSMYSLLSTNAGYSAGGPLDAVWAASFLLIAIAVFAVLNARYRFALPTIAPLANNVIVIASYLIFNATRHGEQPSLLLTVPQILALDGAQILINVSSSPGRDLAATGCSVYGFHPGFGLQSATSEAGQLVTEVADKLLKLVKCFHVRTIAVGFQVCSRVR